MKIMLFSDIHFSDTNEVKLNETIKTAEWIQSVAEKEHPNYILFLGDLFETPEVNPELLSIVNQFITSLTQISPMVMVTGNHEITGESNSKNLLYQLFNNNDKITVVGYNDKGYKIMFLPVNHLFLSFIPYYKSKETIKEKLNNVANEIINRRNGNSISFLFGHFDLLNTGYESLNFVDNNIINVDEFSDYYSVFNKIYLGHVHSRLVARNGKFEYIGSTHSQNFKSLNNFLKGITILKIDNENSFVEKFIENPYSPIYLKINSVEEFNNKIFDFDNRNYYVEFNINNEDVNLLNKNYLLKLSDKKYKYDATDSVNNTKENVMEQSKDFNNLVKTLLLNNLKMLPQNYQKEILKEVDNLL